MKSIFLRRAKVILVECIICSLFVLLLYSPLFLRGEIGPGSYVLTWLLTHLGPLYIIVFLLLFESWRSDLSITIACLVWFGIAALLIASILSYLFRPITKVRWLNTLLFVITAIISFIGVALWFFIGFFSLMMGYT